MGVTLLLTAVLGSDGFSTLVYGTSLAADLSFVVANLAISATFLAMAWARGVRPGVGTLAQIVLVGLVVEVGLATVPAPDHLWARILLVTAALPVLALGIALYLGTHLGADPWRRRPGVGPAAAVRLELQLHPAAECGGRLRARGAAGPRARWRSSSRWGRW